MAIDITKVTLPRKEALAVMEEVRPRLVERLKSGMSRECANKLTAEWLRAQDNILSPYATEVVERLLVPDEEIQMRLKYGDDFTEMYVRVMNAMGDYRK